jgi:hypothetical protein
MMKPPRELGHESSRATALHPQRSKAAQRQSSTPGSWEIADQSFQWIGRGAQWILLRRHSTTDECTLCAATGGALVFATFGGVVGFALSKLSGDISVIGGTILGGLLGVCIGFSFGAVVEIIDSTIKDQLRSINPK